VNIIDWGAVEKTLKQYAEDMKARDALMDKFKKSNDDYEKEVQLNMMMATEGLIFVNAFGRLAQDMGVSLEELLKLASYIPTPPELDDAEEEPAPSNGKPVKKEIKKPDKPKSISDLDDQAKRSYL